jgi:hypothetical protein
MTKDEMDLAKVAADALTKPWADFANRLFGGAADEIGGMWQDHLKFRRLQRQLKLLPKIKELIEEAGFARVRSKTIFLFPY